MKRWLRCGTSKYTLQQVLTQPHQVVLILSRRSRKVVFQSFILSLLLSLRKTATLVMLGICSLVAKYMIRITFMQKYQKLKLKLWNFYPRPLKSNVKPLWNHVNFIFLGFGIWLRPEVFTRTVNPRKPTVQRSIFSISQFWNAMIETWGFCGLLKYVLPITLTTSTHPKLNPI